ncbi:CBS domain-containing protein [Candidatus Woesearchaeota archaeon]|nr:CBS domain-containing protein [Candidatus Woesearchaeota archaeon]
MLYNLQQIKLLRKKYNVTQTQLAKLAGVSQSLITKVEAGLLDPTYTKAQKIFQALSHLSEKKEIKAEEIMNTSLICCSPSTAIKEVIKKMKKHSISQMPVLEDKQPVGLISESIILDAIINNKSSELLVKDLMIDAPPIIAKDSSINIISNLLKFYPLVIVAEKGKFLGIITKADMLGVYNHF